MESSITASVGAAGGSNSHQDVTTVQTLLNRVPERAGGPVPGLAVDGICGPKTIAAIRKFQVRQFGVSGADGRVDPRGRTLARLNGFSAGALAPSLGDGNLVICSFPSPPEIVSAMSFSEPKAQALNNVPRAAGWCAAANFALLKVQERLAQGFADRSDFEAFRNLEEVKALKTHFHI